MGDDNKLSARDRGECPYIPGTMCDKSQSCHSDTMDAVCVMVGMRAIRQVQVQWRLDQFRHGAELIWPWLVRKNYLTKTARNWDNLLNKATEDGVFKKCDESPPSYPPCPYILGQECSNGDRCAVTPLTMIRSGCVMMAIRMVRQDQEQAPGPIWKEGAQAWLVWLFDHDFMMRRLENRSAYDIFQEAEGEKIFEVQP